MKQDPSGYWNVVLKGGEGSGNFGHGGRPGERGGSSSASEEGNRENTDNSGRSLAQQIMGGGVKIMGDGHYESTFKGTPQAVNKRFWQADTNLKSLGFTVTDTTIVPSSLVQGMISVNRYDSSKFGIARTYVTHGNDGKSKLEISFKHRPQK